MSVSHMLNSKIAGNTQNPYAPLMLTYPGALRSQRLALVSLRKMLYVNSMKTQSDPACFPRE